jgi:hypothetical protein
MRTIFFLITFFSFLINNDKNINNKQIPKFKSITEASYYAKRTGLIERTIALEKNKNKISEYNNVGELLSSTQFEMDGSLYEKTTTVLNENGKVLKSIVKDNNGKIKRYLLNEIDKNGKIINVKAYDLNDFLIETQSYSYDANGNCTEYIYNNFKYKYKTITNYKFNSNNQLLEEIFDNEARKEKTTRTFTYDKKGNQIEEYMNCTDGRFTKFISEYDSLNNLISQKWFDKNGKQNHETSFEYVYDNYDNWITKKRSLNGEIDFVWERKIEYYQ